ncbi:MULTISPECIES: CoA transferase subunit A [Brenneria]|uniref:CoA synthetase n=1 Tax=Brenneria nigrifluens DSM 30175 = ATCC 13028 TaxID=1121120 RepID=A0A2U1UPA0_9GAMM|nr:MULTISPECIES: CoA transferase [Brenneria]EHD23408.1 coenzyme A transferase [Brenneria sp. EniD312]PWC23431.1 CoA synthetase [Brenneria nigrifluens] [Brenneria nigrifluens DSM 30175 = ATCC 13028]QCR06335.1 CoA transferase subunit A [Brenneria nigrifluens DSM 30175 = ATCC 13028]
MSYNALNGAKKPRDKLVSLGELAARIADGSSLAVGGTCLHRAPFALIRELIRQRRQNIELIKQSPGYDIDILCRAGVATKARCGIVAMEGNFGLAPWYRRAVETGRLALEEHACATLTAGLRAAAFGVPFQPVAGVHGSDLAALNQWVALPDPYGSGETTWVIPRIKPDVAVIHVAEATRYGDGRVFGTANWDHLISRAAGRVLLTAEKLVEEEAFAARPELTLIPHFLVEAVAVVPRGGWPGSCWPYYPLDSPAIEGYLAQRDASFLQQHLDMAPEASQESVE